MQVPQQSVAWLALSQLLLGQTSQTPIALHFFLHKIHHHPILGGDIYLQQTV
ncbi:hypothetical protein HanPSC8_Chr10g0421791 [Helianthus annuus]|nr:hypothetical protein HanPSC8_Chr10g0421791 [Helianthus annuus]